MTLHLLRLAVGAADVADMRDWCRRTQTVWQNRPVVFGHTRRRPTRTAELLDGGSLYWVVKGVLCIRQRLLGFDELTDEDGNLWCRLVLDPDIVETQPYPKRAFQGWRYLLPQDAPADLSAQSSTSLPPQMAADLRRLGLL